ncbi:MAG: hypothetical protein P4L46_18100 [Fimbriimonas sp.]|nr:hypothetical protein [Fimbriimonas sp.]
MSLTKNTILRNRLGALEVQAPGSLHHAERVAVYSVAVAERLGFSDSNLRKLRMAAELHDLASHSTDGQAQTIIRLCDEFDARRTGFHGREHSSEADALAWLQDEASSEFGSQPVNALLHVQTVIQPVGT